MNELKDFIAENRHLFDQEQLPKGHEERFFSKLPQHRAKHLMVFWRPYQKIAAAAVIIVLVGLGIREFIITSDLNFLSARREMRIETKMLQKYQDQIHIVEEEIMSYASSIPLSDWEQIEYTLIHLSQNRDLILETLPEEMPFAVRRTALEAYYNQNLSGMQQIASLLAQNHNHTY
ncbi:MAG: hypothetical protein FWD56_03880 [Bacteroidales bacterium]|nr:hypothetical protein [Bacteroidales bacterium]